MGVSRLQLVGDVALAHTDRRVVLSRQQPRLVLTYLVENRHRSVARAEIAELLWTEELPSHWSGAVRGVIAKIRAFLAEGGEESWLTTTPDGWRLNLPIDVRVDIDELRGIVTPKGANGDHREQRLDRLVEACRALGGELAPGATGRWIDAVRAELVGLRRSGLGELIEATRHGGPGDVAVGAARELVEADPYSDGAAQTLLEILIERGDRGEALGVYDAFRARLATDLGVAPEPQTAALAALARGRAAPVREPAAGDDSLFGREDEMELVAATWDRIADGARLVLVSGEPGAGKTRLTLEVSRLATGGVVLWGACTPSAGTPFEPVAAALARQLHTDRSQFDGLGDLSAGLLPLLPELGAAGGASRRRVAAGTDRLQLFRTVVALFRALVEVPSIWVVDDAHWADEDTLAMMCHITREVADLPLMIVVAQRRADGAVAGALAEMSRVVPTTRVELAGLSALAIDAWMRHSRIGGDSTGAVVAQRTGGNPFFVAELIRTAREDGRLDVVGIPDSLRVWLEQRVRSLPSSSRVVLECAAVLGDDIDVEVLAAVLGLDPLTVIERATALLDDGLLVEQESGGITFAHAISRDVVYGSIPRERLRRLHRLAADGLRSRHPEAVAEMAAHLAVAGPGAEAEALVALLAAGRQALSQWAWRSAESWFELALQRRPKPFDTMSALVGLGVARRGLADRAGARQVLTQALELIERHATDSATARIRAEATLALVGGGARGVSDDLVDDERAELLRTAILGLDDEDSDLMVELELELALALLLTDQVQQRRELCASALAHAEETGRADTIARALLGGRIAWTGPDHAERRLDEADRILALAAADRPFDVTLAALMARHEELLLIGDRAAAADALSAAAELAERGGPPYWRWVVGTWRSLEAIIDGRLDDAEKLAFEAMQHQVDHPEAVACLGVNLVNIRLLQGRADEMVDLLASAADDNPHIPAYRAVLALCQAESGDVAGARATFDRFATAGFSAIPDDTNWLLAVAVLADVAVTLGDRQRGAELAALLRPHARRSVVLNCFGGGGAWWGTVQRQLDGVDSMGLADPTQVSGIVAAG